MSRLLSLALAVLLSGSAAAQEPAAKWWAHIVFLANDSMNGRDTGSPEHRKAAEYIAAEFKKAGLEPGGTNGYFQPIRFRSRRIEPAPSVEAPIVFAGYGLQVPEAKHDDLAGLDLKGKIVLLLTGGPSHIPGPLLAHYQSIRWEYLKKAGAVGVFSIQNPKGQDIPWDRSKLSRFMPALAIADPALDETLGQQTAVTINPARAERFFTGSGHTFKELLALSLKVGFVKGSPEHQTVLKWRTERYHAPSDDLDQPINRQAAEDFGTIYLSVVQAVANRPTRPQWNGDSFFRRFAR